MGLWLLALLLGSRWNNPSLLTAHMQWPCRCRASFPSNPPALLGLWRWAPFLCMNHETRNHEPKPEHLAGEMTRAGVKASPLGCRALVGPPTT